MRYFKVNEQLEVIEISDKYPDELRSYDPEVSCPWARKADGSWGAGWLNRTDMGQHQVAPLLFAQQIADSASNLTGRTCLAIDSGPDVSPRYDVIEAPAIGDDASKGFNGDYYPVGKITKIGKDYKQITVDGPRGLIKFYRRKLTAAWVQTGGTWCLVPGTRSEWNQEF